MFRRRLLKCSFCGRDETKVSKLVAGATAYICDDCVAAAVNIMQTDGCEQKRIPAQRGLWHRLIDCAKKNLHYEDVATSS